MYYARASFPSGHSSWSFCGLGFVALLFWYTVRCGPVTRPRVRSQRPPQQPGRAPVPCLRLDATQCLLRLTSVHCAWLAVADGAVWFGRSVGANTFRAWQWVEMLLCTPPVFFASLIAASRVRDNYHHCTCCTRPVCGTALLALRAMAHLRVGDWRDANRRGHPCRLSAWSGRRGVRVLEHVPGASGAARQGKAGGCTGHGGGGVDVADQRWREPW